MIKSGFIAIIGRPNAGKSTLINKIVGEKVSIVSFRPQTTRNRILGIINREDLQAVFIDTPGIHRAKDKLSEYMLKSVNNSLEGVDAVLYLLDGSGYMDDIDRDFFNNYSAQAPLIAAVNKSDKAGREKCVKFLSELNGFDKIRAVFVISALRGDNVGELTDELYKYLPPGDKMYPEDMYTDRTMRFIVSEIIREKAIFHLEQEIPYTLGVIIRSYSNRQDKFITDIAADIIAEREAHKPIIIGKGGSMLRKIGEQARLDIERLTGGKVFLKLYVKVLKNWRESKSALEELGYS